MGPLARGAFIGLTVRHGLGHMVRAVLEGVAFSLRDVFALVSETAPDPLREGEEIILFNLFILSN